MRVVLFAESFLPHMNGVTHSLLQVLRHLESRGDEALVVAPKSGPIDQGLHGAATALLRSVPLPSYPEVRLTFARAGRLAGIIEQFRPDVAHLASPFVLGWQAVRAAEHLGVPTVAIYQTDIAGYAERYGIPGAAPALARHVARLHARATLTLAPSTASVAQLEALGVPHIRTWARGVDAQRFQPARRSESWRAAVAPAGEVLVGYVGRLAAEKQVEDLRAITDLPGTRLVVIGDGPSRPALERMLPSALFTGFLAGDELAQALASLDVFVHPGETETFCQSVQEALASGVPVVATGSGGPLDLVHSSVTGWLYEPGNLAELRARVLDLAGDGAKRRAFGAAARASVADRSWSSLGEELIGHYRDAIATRVPAATAAPSPAPSGPRSVSLRDRPVAKAASVGAVAGAPLQPPWKRYVALGDSLTEGLCDTSRMPAGQYRGWADRLALLLAYSRPATDPLRYANLAVRSRRTAEVITEQMPQAIELGADLVSVLVGGNDLVKPHVDPRVTADILAEGIGRLVAPARDVLVVTAFSPRRPYLGALDARFAAFNERLVDAIDGTGAIVLDTRSFEQLRAPEMWAADRVHLNSRGHRALAYTAGTMLGVPDAQTLGGLELAVHEESVHATEEAAVPTGRWLVAHAAPWALRRLRGHTAGEGRAAKHDALVALARGAERPSEAGLC
ncbi:glycosyltransferase [Rathayibacter sp. YIM 133350]|uniref:glycosyltransferase n=1 Tax=Rathayibacter sp. YIM 133350 TaxID=3131992 RepID=UPI00307F249A